MKSGGSKAKGSQWERECCRLLSRWVSHGKRDDLYWRSAMSGGRATVAKRKGIDVRQTGDITAVSPEGHALTDKFFIETKFYKNLAIDSFILDCSGSLGKFWQTAAEQAASHKLWPMLIAKENRRDPLIITRPGHLNAICNPPRSFTNGIEVRYLLAVLGTKFGGICR